MFINVVETMKHPQFMALPSLIWLDTAKHLYSVWPQALYYSLQSGFEFRGTIPDNELVSFLRTGFSCRPDDKQLLCDVVENGSQVMNCVSGNSRNPIGHGVNLDCVAMEAIRNCFRLYLTHNFIWLGITEGLNVGLEIEDVLFGPFNFYLNERSPFIGSHAFEFLNRA